MLYHKTQVLTSINVYCRVPLPT
uniref:Uncharacterized protein n=1 Tax=Arundo donax TaxID=35708 RepID=A0A0A9F1V5_ARUDO